MGRHNALPARLRKSSEDNTTASRAPCASQPGSASSGIGRLHYADRFLTHGLVRVFAQGLMYGIEAEDGTVIIEAMRPIS
jgi:hypothetical protein